MNLVDSCGWLEYFADGSNADFFAPPIQDIDKLIVPSICLLEVFKKILGQRGEGPALQAIALMQQGNVIDLDTSLSLAAAQISLIFQMSLADSVIAATAHRHKATLWTQDYDFRGLNNIKYKAKKRNS